MLNSKGQGMIEYIIIVAMIAISSLSVIRILSRSINLNLTRITDSLQGKETRSVKHTEVKSKHYSNRDLSNFFKGSSSKNTEND